MTAPDDQRGESRSFSGKLNDLVNLTYTYAKQETVDPLRSLGRYLVFGFAGALLLAVGGGLAALAALRAVQSATSPHLTRDLTWVPYVAGLVVTAVGAAWAVTRIGKRGAKGGAQK